MQAECKHPYTLPTVWQSSEQEKTYGRLVLSDKFSWLCGLKNAIWGGILRHIIALHALLGGLSAPAAMTEKKAVRILSMKNLIQKTRCPERCWTLLDCFGINCNLHQQTSWPILAFLDVMKEQTMTSYVTESQSQEVLIKQESQLDVKFDEAGNRESMPWCSSL